VHLPLTSCGSFAIGLSFAIRLHPNPLPGGRRSHACARFGARIFRAGRLEVARVHRAIRQPHCANRDECAGQADARRILDARFRANSFGAGTRSRGVVSIHVAEAIEMRRDKPVSQSPIHEPLSSSPPSAAGAGSRPSPREPARPSRRADLDCFTRLAFVRAALTFRG
jgi:hypothetical protein